VIGGLLDRVFRGEYRRDGQSARLEALGTGLDLTQPDAEPEAAPSGRRHRPLPEPRAHVELVLSQKVLHGWLQNRHQTLFPLAVNLRNMEPDQAAQLAAMAAIAARAGGGPAEEGLQRAATWLRSLGADAGVLRAFDEASQHPPALSATLTSLQEAGLAPYAYVAALIALDPRDAVGRRFLDYLAERLALPPTLVRSADRRYGAGPLRPPSR
jgi:hypothetical protein